MCSESTKIDAYIRHEMEVRKIPGLAFAIVDNGKIVTERAYGLANLETDTPVSTNSVFEIGSVTKPFTATAVMMLVEDGKIQLDDQIIEFIENAPAAWKEITVRQLLSHTSGLGRGHPVERDGSPLLNISIRQQFDDIAKSPLQYAPGEGALYSDWGYFLLGMIIEKVSGKRYSEFMQQRVFSPFGMNATRIEDRRAIVKNHVGEYTLRESQLEHGRRVWQHELPSFYGMWSTVDDLAKWMIALVEGRVVKMETLDQMWTPTKLKNGDLALVDGFPYGLGWFVVDVNGHRVVGHPGFFGSVILHYVDERLTTILLTNLDVAATGPYQVELAQGILAHLRPDIPHWFKIFA